MRHRGRDKRGGGKGEETGEEGEEEEASKATLVETNPIGNGSHEDEQLVFVMPAHCLFCVLQGVFVVLEMYCTCTAYFIHM